MGVKFPEKSVYEDVRYNVISITSGWVGVKFPEKSVTKMYASTLLALQ